MVKTLFQIVILLGGLYGTYRLGMAAYFRQKEYEHVRTRYLYEGFDRMIAQVEYFLGVYRHNWALCLRYAKMCRDLSSSFDASDYFAEFREVDQSSFQIAPAHRIDSLLHEKMIWVLYQKAFAFVVTSNQQLKADFGIGLKYFAANPADTENKRDFVRKAFELAEGINQKGDHYHIFLSELNSIAALFEREDFRRDALGRFVEQDSVQEVLARLRAAFEDELKEEPSEGKPETSEGAALTASS